MKMSNSDVYSVMLKNPDWHLTLGHPIDAYLDQLIKIQNVSGEYTRSKDCEVCQHAKLKNCPHSKTLPMAKYPFFKSHMDPLQITPPNQKGQQYILVLINDFSTFNFIFMMERKNEAESHIKSFLNEIKNKLNIIPAFLHTDQGGEFSSKNFLSKLKNKGICLEQGPPNSPETNGIAKPFNQTLLTKIRCLLGKSNITMSYWDNPCWSLRTAVLNQNSALKIYSLWNECISKEINQWW
ncbi:hypothetical protein O181_031273 [Austropuccinia psidii MF-1]|uniref:Integrase catalytic domain-containing protein n=1 Tax=Austropuccinia psidii MF-1 TaxID=1389203 RepID=A0A9Q3H4G0_9BASI|nr:hypothetical protein [Austropuccinia psidii MF-1]